MNIQRIESHPYKLNFIHPFITAKGLYEHRNGFIIKIYSDSYIGLGEVSPLKNFHKESLQECYYALEAINQTLSGVKGINQSELFQIFKLHAESMPSLLFGLETAVLDILSQESDLPMSKYINKKSKSTLKLNGVHGVHNEKQFEVIKVKLGHNNIYDDIEMLDKLTTEYSKNVKFRIDVNEQLDLVKAIRFCKSIEKFNIDYIEQPLPADHLEDLYELRMHTSIKIALDESITNYESAYKIIENQSADIFVIKPMLVGGYADTNKIIEMARSEEVDCVITNMLDGAINRMGCIHLALSNNIYRECGLSMDRLFRRDLAITPKIKKGKISILNTPGLGISING